MAVNPTAPDRYSQDFVDDAAGVAGDAACAARQMMSELQGANMFLCAGSSQHCDSRDGQMMSAREKLVEARRHLDYVLKNLNRAEEMLDVAPDSGFVIVYGARLKTIDDTWADRVSYLSQGGAQRLAIYHTYAAAHRALAPGSTERVDEACRYGFAGWRSNRP